MTDEEFPARRIALEEKLVVAAFQSANETIAGAGDAQVAHAFQWATILAYALGLPLPEVRDYGRRALLAYREILSQRPPLEAFQKPDASGCWVDYSVGSSRIGVDYLYLALLLREYELGREIAEATWEPPSRGKVRMYPENRVAHAVRDLILGKKIEALAELKELPASAKVYLHKQASAISTLARDARDEVTPAIVDLSKATVVAMRREYLPQFKIFALPGAGLASYALDHGLMTREELPSGIETFPLELVAHSGHRERPIASS